MAFIILFFLKKLKKVEKNWNYLQKIFTADHFSCYIWGLCSESSLGLTPYRDDIVYGRPLTANAPMQCRCQKSGRVANKMQQLENLLWCLIFSVILISLAYFMPWFLQYNTKTIYLCSLTHTMTCISYARYLKGKQSTSIRHEPLKLQWFMHKPRTSDYRWTE